MSSERWIFFTPIYRVFWFFAPRLCKIRKFLSSSKLFQLRQCDCLGKISLWFIVWTSAVSSIEKDFVTTHCPDFGVVDSELNSGARVNRHWYLFKNLRMSICLDLAASESAAPRLGWGGQKRREVQMCRLWFLLRFFGLVFVLIQPRVTLVVNAAAPRRRGSIWCEKPNVLFDMNSPLV